MHYLLLVTEGLPDKQLIHAGLNERDESVLHFGGVFYKPFVTQHSLYTLLLLKYI